MKSAPLAIVAWFLACSLAGGQQLSIRHRIAILDFDHTLILPGVQAVFGSNQNIGREFSDMLADRLTNDGAYRVIDRSAINRVLAEHSGLPDDHNNAGNSHDPFAALTATKVGKVLGVDPIIRYFGVDAIVTGELTQFGRNESKSAGGVFGAFHKLHSGGGYSQKSKAVVGVTAHMIDVNTGEILASVIVKGESIHSGSNLLAGAALSGTVSSMNSSNFPQTILGEAVMQAINQLAQTLEQRSASLPAAAHIPISGLVADVSGTDVTINVGTLDGIHVGDTLLITRTTRLIKDPTTGKIIRTVEDTIGQITITSVDYSSAVGRFSGTGKVAVNDTVKNLPSQN